MDSLHVVVWLSVVIGVVVSGAMVPIARKVHPIFGTLIIIVAFVVTTYVSCLAIVMTGLVRFRY